MFQKLDVGWKGWLHRCWVKEEEKKRSDPLEQGKQQKKKSSEWQESIISSIFSATQTRG